MSFSERTITELKRLREQVSSSGAGLDALTSSLQKLQLLSTTVGEVSGQLAGCEQLFEALSTKYDGNAGELASIERGRITAEDLLDEQKDRSVTILEMLSAKVIELAQKFSPPIKVPVGVHTITHGLSSPRATLPEIDLRVDALIELNRVMTDRLKRLSRSDSDHRGEEFLFTSLHDTAFEFLACRVATLSTDLSRLKRLVRSSERVADDVRKSLEKEDFVRDRMSLLESQVDQLKDNELRLLEKLDDTRRHERELGAELRLKLDAILQELVEGISKVCTSKRGPSHVQSELKRVRDLLIEEQAVEIIPGSAPSLEQIQRRFRTLSQTCGGIDLLLQGTKRGFGITTDLAGGRFHGRWMIVRDVPEVLEIDTLSFRRPWLRSDFHRKLKAHNAFGFVAEFESQIKGYIVYELGTSEIRVVRMAVHPDQRRSGIGEKFISRLISKLDDTEKGRSEVIVDVPEECLYAQQLFKKLGFHAVEIIGQHAETFYRMKYYRDEHLFD
jgi:ribosomal-protein-alanine N-acetyltransferase